MESGPPPALVLVPAQEPLGLLGIRLHPGPPLALLHHRLQRHPPAEVAPGVPPLAGGDVLPDPPAELAAARGGRPPAADRDEPAAEPALAPLAHGTDRHDRGGGAAITASARHATPP